MTLDDRVRAAMQARLDTLEVPAFDPGRRRPDRKRRTSRQLVIATVTILGLVTAGVAILADRGADPAAPSEIPEHAPGDPIPLMEIPPGVSAHRIGWQPTFFVRTGREITVFLTDPQHLPGERTLWWCPQEEVFVAPTHGELFASDGTRIEGPGRAGLSRLPAIVEGGALLVSGSWNDTPPIAGPQGQKPSEYEIPPGYDYADRGGPGWNTGPGSFCQDPIVSGPSERFRWRDEDQGSEPMMCADVTQITYRGNVLRVRPAITGAIEYWFSWNETWFGPPDLGPGTAPQAFVVVLDGRVQMEIRVAPDGDGYRVVGFAHCTESHPDLFAVSEKNQALFGPLVTMPECEPVGRAGYSAADPTTDPDETSCRADGNSTVQVPCGRAGEAPCPGGPHRGSPRPDS